MDRLKDFSSDFFPESWKNLFTGIVAYVDVRTDSDNRSKSIATEMETMGATVLANFSKKVTHVIFKDGSKPIYDRAKSLGIPILSYLWIVACKDKCEIVPTAEHPAINSQDYDSPFFKWRKVKSMQPKDIEEELKLIERKLARRRKKAALGNKIVEEMPVVHTPVIERKSVIDTLIESSPMVQERIRQELASGKTYDDVFTLKEGEEDDFDTYFDTPLMIKFIARNYYSPRDPPPASLRKILSDVKRQATTPVIGNNEKSCKSSPVQSISQTFGGSPLHITGNKRKKDQSTASTSKKRKENVEDTEDKMPRRKLLFQPLRKFGQPEDPLVALTPDDSPKKSKRKRKHPCFSQITTNDSSLESRMPKPKPKNSFPPKDVSQSPRRDSWADFKLNSPKKQTLVCTSMHSKSISIVENAVTQLRGFTILDTVNDTTTHVVCGESKRTINVMRGVVRGAWLLNINWVQDSITQGKWLDEEKYTVERFSAAAAIYRQGKRSLFKDYGPIYISSKSPIPQKDLRDLIKCAGGLLTSVSNQASLIVGQWKSKVNVPCINGTWILDCIEKGLTLPLTDYIMTH